LPHGWCVITAKKRITRVGKNGCLSSSIFADSTGMQFGGTTLFLIQGWSVREISIWIQVWIVCYLNLTKTRKHTGLFTRGALLNFYFAATNNTNDSNYQIKRVISFKLEIKVSWIDLWEMSDWRITYI
jgi:hypothetical protein